MIKSTLTTVGVALAVTFAASAADPVYSLNTIGYYNVTVAANARVLRDMSNK